VNITLFPHRRRAPHRPPAPEPEMPVTDAIEAHPGWPVQYVTGDGLLSPFPPYGAPARLLGHGGHDPYPAKAAITDALACLDDEGPRPAFIPRHRCPVDTAAMEEVPSIARGPRRYVPESRVVLEQVLDGLRNLPVPAAGEPPIPLVPLPAREESRPAAFVADMRFRDGLAIFRKTAHAVGWSGLDNDPWQGWVRYSTARWQQQAAAAIDRAVTAARTEILRAGDEMLAREERIRAAADVGAILSGGAL